MYFKLKKNTWLYDVKYIIICRELSNGFRKTGQSFPMANFEKLLILLIQIICFCMKYPYSINSLSYECDYFRMDFHIGQSTPAIRTFSSACPNPNPIINIIEFRSHVSPVYVPAHILPPNTILNQCTMLCCEPDIRDSWVRHMRSCVRFNLFRFASGDRNTQCTVCT